MIETARNSAPERNPIEILRLTSESEWREAAAVMQVLRPTLEVEPFAGRRIQLQDEGYCLLGIRMDGRMVAIASYTISPHVMLGRELLIHDMATITEARGRGCASSLISELIKIAASHNCGRLFVHTRNAQGLYGRNGFEEYSSGMIRRLS
jgi:ribosomal protein S18 acetylase RimI-like enzyme